MDALQMAAERLRLIAAGKPQEAEAVGAVDQLLTRLEEALGASGDLERDLRKAIELRLSVELTELLDDARDLRKRLKVLVRDRSDELDGSAAEAQHEHAEHARLGVE